MKQVQVKEMSTIQDVAKRASVGAATVSRVLNGNGYVKEETREKVMRAIEELDYTPNEMARNLFFKRTGIVAIIIPQISHPFFAEFVDEAMLELAKYNYKVMVCNTWDESHYELQYLEMLQRSMVDGIIFGAHSLDIREYQNAKRPIVALDRELGAGIPCVSADHQEGGRLAAEVLMEAGCKKVLQFCGKKGVSTPSFQRHACFERIFQEHGLECHNFTLSRNSFSYGYFHRIVEGVFEQYPDIDGIFGTDIIVMNAIRRAAELGIRVPEDLKAVAYDGTGVTGLMHPDLTTVVQPIGELARECVHLMMELTQGNAITQTSIKLPVILRKGMTT